MRKATGEQPQAAPQPYRALARAVGLSCALLFCALTFALVFCIKGELLAYAQHVYAHGLTRYDPLIGAVIITLVLQALQMVVARLSCLNLRVHALSYLPSCLVLVMLTNITPEVVAHFHFGIWAWLAPLLLLLYVFLVLLSRQFIKPIRHIHDATLFFVSNHLILFALLALTACIDINRDTFLYELKQERLIRAQRYDEAARVGEKCLAPTARMLQLRAYALARNGQLPERLFDMPQCHGAAGLLQVGDTCAALRRLDTSDICQALGAFCGRVSSTEVYLYLLRRHLSHVSDSLALLSETLDALSSPSPADDSLRTQVSHDRQRNGVRQRLALDYYLLLQLLERRLDSLPPLLQQRAVMYGDSVLSPRAQLPRAYAEALCLIDTLNADTATLHRYRQYQAFRESIAQSEPRRNLTRRRFGNTYWWYYDYASDRPPLLPSE